MMLLLKIATMTMPSADGCNMALIGALDFRNFGPITKKSHTVEAMEGNLVVNIDIQDLGSD